MAARDTPYDIAVVGGGINGCGIARDAAGRGARVLLLEQGDLATGTSSASSKLIHGGLRYLEHREFGLVREALLEREKLRAIAPHVIWPLHFVLPHVPGLRSYWLLRAGLFLYDHLGAGTRSPRTRTIRLQKHPAGTVLRPEYTRALVFSDCWGDDARLVVLNARDAANRGADIRTRCRVTAFMREEGGWRITAGGAEYRARALVNAAGPGAVNLLAAGSIASSHRMRLVRGSHIVTRKLFDHPYPYFLQLPDRRIFFAIPYEEDFTLIGTTDAEHTGPLDQVQASEEEIAYLCAAANRFFRQPIGRADVLWSFAGVRPLVHDGSGRPEDATRGYRLQLSPQSEGAPLLTVFGGKLTVYRHLAQEAVDLLGRCISLAGQSGWTGAAALPGGDFPADDIDHLEEQLRERYSFLDARTIRRIARAYGTFCFTIFGERTSRAECGRQFGHGLHQCEVDYLMAREWARTADDVLWRRTKLGLRFSPAETAALTAYMIREPAA
ncbi:glycerol-3-phosphate dehydrogenase [Porphyrobacter sp. GA68]|uniref:glycerol-3-phosphate dehydrogenase n=1 Tax=Porphyrobacter sp. GA68 TaxID=2883480 RepID=UPI001D17F265|nr:glycerol-3-phosphate dehydrogenase [Porphyrobacter sp. GA68]